MRRGGEGRKKRKRKRETSGKDEKVAKMMTKGGES